MCGHKRVFSPPLSERPLVNGRKIRPSDIPCSQCIVEDRERFHTSLRNARIVTVTDGERFWQQIQGGRNA